jgi:hypothetical protein
LLEVFYSANALMKEIKNLEVTAMDKLSVFSKKLGTPIPVFAGAVGGTVSDQKLGIFAASWSNGGWSNYSSDWLNGGWNNSSSGWQNAGWNNYSSGWTNDGWNNYSSGWTNGGWNNGGGK